jgi:hypothetical protein
MSLTDADEIKIPAEALSYIENRCGPTPFKYEIIELFFDWLRKQDSVYIVNFLKEALK